MTDSRIQKFARILVDYSTNVQPGDRVAIYTSTAAEALVQALYARILDRGGYPHVLLDFADQDEIFFAHANDDQLDFVPLFHKTAFEEFDVLLKIRADTNTRSLGHLDPQRQARHQKSFSKLLAAQMRRGADNSLRWMSTLFPTRAYAMEADMGFEEYQDFVYRACHADDDTPDPVAYWQGVEREQQRIVERIEGHDRVEVRGPNVDLSLSIKGRKFRNGSGQNNIPDGEVYTGPVEESANGWVRYTYPAIYQGRIVEGIELKFENGAVVHASAQKNEEFLLQMLNSDPGARYLGEFAIGTNYNVDRFTRSILFDEKIGGSFHMAVGAGYPETGSHNRSIIHWDMICDLRQDSEIRVDGELVYRNGKFTF
ncbi:MAG TPA: aminopeptidase [Anaerolineales bacterium]